MYSKGFTENDFTPFDLLSGKVQVKISTDEIQYVWPKTQGDTSCVRGDYVQGWLLHREDGPAYICAIKNRLGEIVCIWRVWYKNGQFHREDGPAMTSSLGDKRWYLNDHEYDKEEYYLTALENRRLLTKSKS